MADWQILEALIARISERRGAEPDASYVAQLLSKGTKKIAQKVAEEGSELAIAAVSEGKQSVINEAADLLFHLLVLCEDQQITMQEILAELDRRDGLSGLTEKANRND